MRFRSLVSAAAIAASGVFLFGFGMLADGYAKPAPWRSAPNRWQFQVCGYYAKDHTIVAGPCDKAPIYHPG